MQSEVAVLSLSLPAPLCVRAVAGRLEDAAPARGFGANEMVCERAAMYGCAA